MRRKMLVVALVLVAAAILWVYTSMPSIVWDGSIDLTVHVSSNPGPPRSVSCEVFYHREDAEYVLEHLLPPAIRRGSATADPFTGKPLFVSVPVGGWKAMSGRQLQRSLRPYLVVIAELPDGRRVGKLVDLPGGLVDDEVVSVELP